MGALRRTAVALVAIASLCAGCGSASDLAGEADPAPATATATAEPDPSPSPPTDDPTDEPTDDPTQTPPTDEPDDPTGAPEVGACHGSRPDEVAYAALYRGVRRGDCDRVHRSQTFLVEELRGRTGQALVDGDAARLEELVRPLCIGGLRRWTGASSQLRLARTQLVAWVVAPTTEQVDDGARWVSCEAAVRGARGTATAVRGDLADALRRADSSPYDTCVRGSLRAVPVTSVPCSEPHRYRSVQAVSLGGPDDPYPGGRVLDRTLSDACRAPVRRYLDADGEFRYGWTYPPRENWREGRRAGVCLVPSTR